MVTTTLDLELRADPTRCADCGYHVPTQGHGEQCAPVAPASEWQTFLAALRSSVRDGRISQTDVRPKIRGVVYHKAIGSFYTKAEAEGYIKEVGEERSTDLGGRNTHHRQRVFRPLPRLLAA